MTRPSAAGPTRPARTCPVIEGTLIRLVVPGAGPPGSRCAVGPGPGGRRRAGRAPCGRPTCAGSTSSTLPVPQDSSSAGPGPLLRDPAAADGWTWLLLACHAQLYLARAWPGDPDALAAGRQPAGGDDSRPGPRGISPRPRNRRQSRQRRETRQTRPRTADDSKNKHKAPASPSAETHPKPGQRKNPAKKTKQTG